LVAALLVGGAFGAAGSSQQEEVDRLNSDLGDSRADLRNVREDLDAARTENESVQSDLEEAEATVERLSAKGEVPDFTGGTVSEAESAAQDYDWRIKTTEQASSDAAPGTVISQTPAEGTTLKAGRSIALVVAKKPPPSWKTIYSFSGSGARKSDEFTIPAGAKTRIAYTFTGDTNAILQLGIPGGDEFSGELLLNEIGDYSDTTRVYGHSGRRFLDVEGGNWTIEVQVYR
jgi:hypothetical protein